MARERACSAWLKPMIDEALVKGELDEKSARRGDGTELPDPEEVAREEAEAAERAAAEAAAAAEAEVAAEVAAESSPGRRVAENEAVAQLVDGLWLERSGRFVGAEYPRFAAASASGERLRPRGRDAVRMRARVCPEGGRRVSVGEPRL